MHLAAGLSVGLSGLAAGYTIGIVGDAVRMRSLLWNMLGANDRLRVFGHTSAAEYLEQGTVQGSR